MVNYNSLTVKVEMKYLLTNWFSDYHLIFLINQKFSDENNKNKWQQEPHFIQNQKQALQAFTLQTYWLCPT